MSAFGSGFGGPSAAFGAPSSSAFGAPSAFGQSSASGFGAIASGFGASSGGGLFGAPASQPAQGFGAFGQSAPAPFGGSSVFGASAAQPASAFGAAGAFGGSAFGTQSTSAFGASAPPAFGASSQSLFGSGSGAFGASSGSSLFGSGRPPTGGAFGASASGFGQSQSAWGGAPSSSAFGATGAFGASSGAGGLFGSSAAGGSLFGTQSNTSFGAGAQAQVGTAGTNWQLTLEYDGSPGVASKYQAISMMPAFRDRSLEELRLQDYNLGNKGGSAPAPGGGDLFGQAASSGAGLFANSGGAFGATAASSSAFGAQNQATGFGALSGGGLFGGGGGFGNTSGFGQSSGSGFGAAGAFGSAGAFGQSGGSTVFGSQSGNAFGGGGFGAGAPGFGSTGGAFGGGGAFGQSGGAVGSGGGFSGGGGGGFGANGFGAANTGQPAGTGPFGQGSAAGGFGAPQSQQSLTAAQPSTGGGAFGAPSAPTGASAFGAPAVQSAGIFMSAPSNSLFAGATGAASAPSSFGANTGGQTSLFGVQSQPSAFGAPSQGGTGQFGNVGTGFTQSAPSTGFGFGGAGVGGQPSAQQGAQPGMFSNASQMGHVVGNGQGGGFNPSVQNTLVAVTQYQGGTVAPPGANYGTVLHNLQKLQSDLDEHNRRMEQQTRSNDSNAQRSGGLSVLVLPSPPLVKLAPARRPSAQNFQDWSADSPSRTKMRGTVGRIGGGTSRVSGTPLRLPASATKSEQKAKPSSELAVTPKEMPFFSPRQFSASKSRPLRSADITTPHKSTPIPLPLPENLRRSNETTPGKGEASNIDKRVPFRSPATNSAPHSTKNRTTSLQESVPELSGNGDESAKKSGRRSSAKKIAAPGAADKSPPSNVVQKSAQCSGSEKKKGSGMKSSGAAFMWSSPRPSAWSRNLPLDSADQYNPEKYLPYLTKEDYYVIPSMAELSSMTMKELQSIEDFTVGRKGFGEVTWIEPVDVRGLNLDDVVEIQKGEVAVFPDRQAEQLDAAAVVTLFGMYKKDKKTKTPVRNSESAAKYECKLRAFCEGNDLDFLSYDPVKGRWQFEVPGFSDST